ncbi:spore coat protein [Planctomycetota bacterium]|nr:spore coat protein [Planctomycetota bacterium]
MTRVVAIIQARMGSTRLPGKVLKPLAGAPMLHRVVERALRIPAVNEVVVATSVLPEESPIVAWCAGHGVRCVRGSADDVLSRYHLAAAESQADWVIRITSDCPLLSPAVSAFVLGAALAGGCDYASNCHRRTFPRGLDTEVFTRAALDQAAAEAVEPSEREHVTPFIWRRPDRYRLRDVWQPDDRSHLRWTVDTPSDFDLADRFYLELGGGGWEYADALQVLARHPDWADLNRDIVQKPV